MIALRLDFVRLAAAIALAAASLLVTPAAAQGVRDCPLAKSRYSSDTPLIDLLVDVRAQRVLEAAGLLRQIPPMARRARAPGFAVILSPRVLGKQLNWPAAQLKQLDADLGAIAIRPQDVPARCGRYEAGRPPPSLMPSRRPAVLVFDKSTGFRDGPSVTAATEMLRSIGERRGWEMVFTSNATAFTPALLRRFDAVVWNNVSGDVLTLRQRRAFRGYIEGGGGFVGLHGSGGDPIYLWDWYADVLIGARFAGHPMNPQFQTGRVMVEDRSHPVTRRLDAEWTLNEEWYSFSRSPRQSGAHILLTLDERSYTPGPLAMGDHPIAWTRCIGRGGSFYSAIGHRPENYRDTNTVRLVEQGLAWVADARRAGCGRRAG